MPTHTRTPRPPLPPTPPAAAHRRHRTFSSSSSSSSSTSSSLSTASSAASSPSPSPSPSPRGAATGRSTTTTSVPFSWEHHPGIPKTRLPSSSPPTAAPLPLPPPLRAPPSSAARRRRAAPPCSAADPFAAALAECTRDCSSASAGSDAGLIDSLFPASPARPSSRRWSIAAAAGGGFLDLYGCKNAMAVAEGAFVLRRPVAVARPGHGRAGQGRAGRAGGRR